MTGFEVQVTVKMMKKTAHGFTLVEILVVITIMAFIGAFSLANFRSFGEDQKLKNAALDVQSLIRTAQINTTSSTICDTSGSTLSNDPNCITTNSAVWRVCFRDGKIIELQCKKPADSSPAIKKTLDLNSISPDISIGFASGKVSKVSQGIGANVVITNPCPTNLGFPISFTSPDGKIVFGDASCTGIQMILTNSKTGSTKDLIIEQGGRVYVQ